MPDPGDHSGPPLENRVAVVTGAATGIGLAIAKALGARGAQLVLNDIDGERLQAAASELSSTTSPTLVAADISDEAGVDRVFSEAESLEPHVDILVNNAGVLLQKDFVDHTAEDWDRVIRINLRGPFLCMHRVVPGMIRAGRGSIVNISSISAVHVTTPHVAYAASKAGVISLTRDAAHELAAHGIRVNTIAPGPTATAMTLALDQEVKDGFSRRMPLGRWGDPADVAAAVAFLVSDDSSYITGAVLPVTGGADLQLGYAATS